jgi:hypothetical protein
MKKTLLAALFAFAAVSKSHAVGYIIFDNYDSSPYMPIDYTQGVTTADPNIHADLLYFLGTTSNPSQLTALGLSVPISASLFDGFGNHGYFEGGVVAIPGYVSGPVTFQVEAWQTAGPEGGSTYGTSMIKGSSFLWTESSLAGPGIPVNFFAGLPGPNGDANHPLLVLIPEPSIMALSGIGLAALMLNRRRLASKRSEDGKKQV